MLYNNVDINSLQHHYSELIMDRESELLCRKYYKILDRFMKTFYPNLYYYIGISYRNPRVKKLTWHERWYFELNICDVDHRPVYNPTTFDAVHKLLDGTGNFICMMSIYDEIESFVPELNKHTEIRFKKHHSELPFKTFDCWDEYFYRSNHVKLIWNLEDFGRYL